MIKIKKTFTAIILLTIFFVGCKPEEPSTPPNDPPIIPNNPIEPTYIVDVTTYTPEGITSTSAMCGGEATVRERLVITELGVCLGTLQNPTIEGSRVFKHNTGEPFGCTILGLEPGTEYHVRAYAMGDSVCFYGEDKAFMTLDPYPPVLGDIMHVVNVTSVSVTVEGSVVDDAGLPLTEVGVCWGLQSDPEVGEANTVVGTLLYASFVCEINDLEPNTAYHVRPYAINDAGIGYGNDEIVLPFDSYVDLGLPSGTLWATYNVGAETPQDIGDYFAWGEIQPKTYYSDSTYVYCNGSLDQLTKYCNITDFGYNGFTDNLTILLQEDDAATVNWGDDWRIPTNTEWRELFQNVPSVKTRVNGRRGRLFTATNDRSIFLPPTGYYWENEWQSKLSEYYWTSSVNSYDPECSYFFFWDPDDYNYLGRNAGLNVRPVRSSN